MSLVIRGGFDAVRKQILNVTLKRTAVWTNGIIYGPKNFAIGQLNPGDENHFELVKYKYVNAMGGQWREPILLLHNNRIIYEHAKLFDYKIDLLCPIKPEWTNENLKTIVDIKYVELNAIETLEDTWRIGA